jgi:hypothetical protein
MGDRDRLERLIGIAGMLTGLSIVPTRTNRAASRVTRRDLHELLANLGAK